MLFIRKKKPAAADYDPAKLKPVLRKSICTGEVTAGFRNRETGAFHDICLIRTEEDLKSFMDTYGISERPETEY